MARGSARGSGRLSRASQRERQGANSPPELRAPALPPDSAGAAAVDCAARTGDGAPPGANSVARSGGGGGGDGAGGGAASAGGSVGGAGGRSSGGGGGDGSVAVSA